MSNENAKSIVYTQMKTRRMGEWHSSVSCTNHSYTQKKRRLRNMAISMAAVFCLGIGGVNLVADREKSAQVMAHISADFEYDDTLGRLQFVSNILPDSAMVFLEKHDDNIAVFAPADGMVIHAWIQSEPWIEYNHTGTVSSCSDGDVMTVIHNRDGEYTVRVLHDQGYESIYSGLNEVSVAQFDQVLAGQQIGASKNLAAFELRKDGLSIMPQFHQAELSKH